MQKVTVSLALFCATAVFADEVSLSPLLDVIEAKGPAEYVHARCAGLYAAGYEFADKRGDESADNEFADAIGFHIVFAMLERGEPLSEDVTEPSSALSDEIDVFREKYSSIMEGQYISSGEFLGPFVGQDLEVCRALKEHLVQQGAVRK